MNGVNTNKSLDNFWSDGTQQLPVYNQSNVGYNDMYGSEEKSNISLGNWLLLFFLLSIPVVNLIVLIVQATVASNFEKKVFARAVLFWGLTVLAFVLVLLVIFYDTFDYVKIYDQVVLTIKKILNNAKK